MTHASLFSGIGGPEVAAAMLGWENAFHCEINPFGRAVLEYWFPDSVSYEDITKTDFKPWRGRIDVLTGGFPCQPFSYAGQRRGHEDDRYLWPQMLRAIDEIRPAWVVGENVAGITTMVEGGQLADLGAYATLFQEGDELHGYELEQTFTIERICGDLERLGYSVQPVLIPAAAVGAPHRRDRIFILAHDRDSDRLRSGCTKERGLRKGQNAESEGVCREIRRDASDTEELQRDGGIAGHGGEFGGRSMRESGNNRGEGVPSSDTRDNGVQRGDFKESKGRKDKIGEDWVLLESTAPTCGGWSAADPHGAGREESVQPGRGENRPEDGAGMDDRIERFGRDLLPENRWAGFPTISPIHRGNDGIPIRLDHLSIPFSKWRTESLKAYGNAIVPQVMYQIFKAIETI